MEKCEKCENEKVSRYRIHQFKKNERIINTYYGCSKCDHRWETRTTEMMEKKNDNE